MGDKGWLLDAGIYISALVTSEETERDVSGF